MVRTAYFAHDSVAAAKSPAEECVETAEQPTTTASSFKKGDFAHKLHDGAGAALRYMLFKFGDKDAEHKVRTSRFRGPLRL